MSFEEKASIDFERLDYQSQDELLELLCNSDTQERYQRNPYQVDNLKQKQGQKGKTRKCLNQIQEWSNHYRAQAIDFLLIILTLIFNYFDLIQLKIDQCLFLSSEKIRLVIQSAVQKRFCYNQQNCISMSQKKIYNYLNIVKNYTHLSDSQFVQKFLDYLKRFVVSEGFTAQQLESSKSCFIIAENMKQALFLISLCFGGRQIANEFFKHMADKRSHQDLLMKLKSFAYEGTPLQIFETNAKLYGSQYPFYRKNIIDLLTEEQCWQMFIKAKQSINLHGVKIRKWPEFYQKRNSFKKLTREFEEDEVKLKGDTTYLYIGGEQNLVVGMINCNAEIQTELDNSRKLNECELPIENLKAKTNNQKKQSAANQQSERKLFKPSQQSKNFRSQTQLVAQNINKNMSTNESIIQKDEGKPSALLKCKQFLKRCLFCCCQ